MRGWVIIWLMSEEIELAAKTSAEVVAALADASGALGPPQELWGAITSGLHYRFYPRLIKQALMAAEKIRASGLPRSAYGAVPDRLLKGILEGGSLEEDESMQERWANLLANALTTGSPEVRRAFPTILGEIEPAEAAHLDMFADEVDPGDVFARTRRMESFKGLHPGGVGNLVRLRLLDYVRTMPNTAGKITDDGSGIFGVKFTRLGWVFVQACRSPASSDDREG